MVNERYGIAMAETLHYLKGISQDDINKIPDNFITFLKNNASQNYECKFDYTRPLKELNLKNETRGLIAMICLNYWCETEEQKDAFREHLNKNEKQYQEELRKKYNPDDIFHKKTSSVIQDLQTSVNLVPVTNNNKWYQKIFLFFKKILNRNIND